MRLWTIQPLSFWDLSQKRGVMCSDREHVEQDFLLAYDWMLQQMAKRLPSFSGHYPIWAWPKRPDLRSYCQDFSAEPHVMLTLEVPNERVLLSDFDGWHFVLNGWYLALTEEEDERSELRKPLPDEIAKAWEYIFDPKQMTPYVSNGRQQACVDQVLLTEVVGIQHIKQRKRRCT